MAAMKCPGLLCAFYFDAALVPAGAIITCPSCDLRYTLPTPQPFDPYGGSPLAADFQATLPLSSPVVTTPGPIAFGQAAKADRGKPPLARRRPGLAVWKQYLKIGLIAGGLTAIVVVPIAALVISNRIRSENPANTGRETVVADKNFAFRLPEAPWKKDVELQSELGVNVVALSRAEPPHAAALHVIDFENRQPSTTELRDEMNRILNRHFLYIPTDLAMEPAKWGKHTATKVLFRGERKTTGVVTLGEVYLLSHKGLAYWFFTWAAEADAAAASSDLSQLRDRFRTLEFREKWSETKSAERVFRSSRGNGRFRLSTTETLWTESDVEATAEDPKAELLLKGVLKSRGVNDFAPKAQVTILVLPDVDAAAATAYLKARWTKDAELFGPTTITELTGDPIGEPVTADKPATELPTVRWKVSTGGPNASKSSEKLIVFSIMMTARETIVAEGSSPWSEHELWERRLMHFVAGLRP